MDPNLAQHYLLVPHLRFTGERTLLLWHTEWEANQLLIARNTDQLIQLWHSVLLKQKRNDLPTIKEAWQANIVLPPQSICKQYAKDSYEQDLMNFKYHLGFEIDTAERRGFPSIITGKCENYKADPRWTDGTEEQDKNHTECVNCCNRYILPRSIHKLFAKALTSGWFKRQVKVTKPFDGIQASSDQPLYYAQLNAGDHNTGITIHEVDEAKHSYSQGVLFFFHGSQIDVPTACADALSNITSIRASKAEKSKFDFESKRKAREKADYDNLCALLE